MSRLDDLFATVILTGIFSLITACLYLTLDAVDVSFTEAAVGGGIATILFISTVALTTHHQKAKRGVCIPGVFIVLSVAILLMYGISDIAQFGYGDAPVHQYLAERYIVQSLTEIGVPNMVTSILASYRGYDTMGEVTVIFTASIAVLMLLSGNGVDLVRNNKTEKDS